jgi:hypothetical protein
VRRALLLLLLSVALPGCLTRQVFITDVRPGPRGSLIVGRCTLQYTWVIWSSTGWTDCKDNVVRAAYVEPAASSTPAAEPAK